MDKFVASWRFQSPRGGAACLLAVAMLGVAGCGPVGEPKDATTGKPSVADSPIPPPSVPAAAAVDTQAATIKVLQSASGGQSFTWQSAVEVKADVSDEPAKIAGQKAIKLQATPAITRHFAGLRMPDSAAPITYHVKLWLKASPDVGLNIEAAGTDARADGRPKDYANEYFDLSAMTVQTRLVAADVHVKSPAIVADGDWKAISFDFPTKDGHFTLNIGLAVNGSHTFPGTDSHWMTIGGLEIAPVK